MKITAVADEQTCTWLKMSGIGEVHPITDPNDAGDVLKSLAKNIDLSIILITPEIAKANSRIVQANLSKKDVFPIMLELPIGETSTGLQDLISAALGIDFQL
ncbi:MAG: V-type ATP synthase subunit F [Candidatus Hodarchaeales archaeon]|jgi:vacuolar-type H+-ATPase subunit F/Vma7